MGKLCVGSSQKVFVIIGRILCSLQVQSSRQVVGLKYKMWWKVRASMQKQEERYILGIVRVSEDFLPPRKICFPGHFS